MVEHAKMRRFWRNWLSVLALSSRFDGLDHCSGFFQVHQLSVLALSSRFDGPRAS